MGRKSGNLQRPYTSTQKNTAKIVQSKRPELVIAIDFGTTFTGVAYANTYGTALTADRSIIDNIVVVKMWPSHSSHFAEKTPSVLSYSTDPPSWGGNATKPNDPLRVAHFKLGLQENVASHYAPSFDSRASTHAQGGYLADPNWKHPAFQAKGAINFTADYLTLVVEHLKNNVLPHRYGENFLQRQKLSWVITVPAIWSDKAKESTRLAASIATETPVQKLTLITEPEAAALFCATLCQEVDLKEGDRFLICDAGGGTVDLISYRVVTQHPFAIEECSVGTGAACGSIYLDQEFVNLVKRRFARCSETCLTESKHIAELVRYFDSFIKLQFNPFDPAAETNFEIPIPGNIADIPWIGFKDGYLSLTKDDIQRVFSSVFDQIYELINDQIAMVAGPGGAKLKTLFLVGGLGSNLYLHSYLEARLRSLVDVKQPEAGYSAIMRGAVLHKLGVDLVRERVMRTSYGTANDPPFRPGYHPEDLRFQRKSGKDHCKGVMHWFAKKGDKVATGSAIECSFNIHVSADEYLHSDRLPWSETLFVSHDAIPPEYHGIHGHGEMQVDLRRIPLRGWRKENGPRGRYYSVDFELGLVFGAGGIEFRFSYEGNIIGAVPCAYF